MSVLFETRGLCHMLTLCNEKALNALTVPMIHELLARYQNLAQLPRQSALAVLLGSGRKAFCAGGDVVSIAKNTPKGVRQEFFYEEYRCNLAIHKLPQFQVSILDGIVMGGGVGVSIHGTFRVATENTLFAMPETAIGLFPDVGGSYFLPRLRHKGLGRFLGLTGYQLRGADTVHAGIATHYIPSDRVSGVLDDLARLSDVSMRDAVTNVFHCANSYPLSPFTLEPYLPEIEECFGNADSVTDVLRRLKAIATSWGSEMINLLVQLCPLSLFVTWELLNRGAAMNNLFDVLQMEYMVAQRCLALGEFDKGVNEMLIAKTKRPKWNPPLIKEVTPNMVEEFFRLTPGTPTWSCVPYADLAKSRVP